jgi:hypothetical protein
MFQMRGKASHPDNIYLGCNSVWHSPQTDRKPFITLTLHQLLVSLNSEKKLAKRIAKDLHKVSSEGQSSDRQKNVYKLACFHANNIGL